MIINRIDELSAESIAELASLIAIHFPGMPCLHLSATTGQGFDAFCEYLELKGNFGNRVMNVDYDVYAEGEAALGWLNAQAVLLSSVPFKMDDFIIALLDRINLLLNEHSAEVAHLKLIGMADGQFSVANLVSSSTAPRLSIESGIVTVDANLVINARVAVDPELLTASIENALHQVCEEYGISPTMNTLQCFRPGRPEPTHRLSGVD